MQDIRPFDANSHKRRAELEAPPGAVAEAAILIGPGLS